MYTVALHFGMYNVHQLPAIHHKRGLAEQAACKDSNYSLGITPGSEAMEVNAMAQLMSKNALGDSF